MAPVNPKNNMCLCEYIAVAYSVLLYIIHLVFNHYITYRQCSLEVNLALASKTSSS